MNTSKNPFGKGEKMMGIDVLRKAVALFGNCREGFSQQWSAEDLWDDNEQPLPPNLRRRFDAPVYR